MSESGTATVFRDVLFLALLGFLAIVIFLLPHLNPPGKEATSEVKSPGAIIVEVRWPDELNADVDLWVHAPGDIPVGYSNKGGLIFNLVRDDLGHYADPLELNYENAYGRAVVPGEYTVNLHLYRNSTSVYPVEATVSVSVKRPGASDRSSPQDIVTSKVELEHEGQELTVFRFKLDERGFLVPGSVHNLQRGLRSWKGKS